jgi:hypothetical protein
VKRIAAFLLIAIACGGIGWSLYQSAAPGVPDKSLSSCVPAGPMLYIEAQDFSSLLSRWNASEEESTWVSSTSYEVFSRSRLFLRLKGASDQFAAAAGIPPDMHFLTQVAGDHSALALYDIGKLQFLYITHLPSAKATQTNLWQTRSKFEPRTVGNFQFYVRRDPESQREVAFAVAGDYLLLATREDLIAGALQLMAGGHDRTIESEQWWAETTTEMKQPGDLRMVLDLAKIVPDGYFRTYWVQQNITDLSHYSAALSDLYISGKQYREERTLVRKSELQTEPAPEAIASTADVIRLVPEDAGFYEASAAPAANDCLELLKGTLLQPHLVASLPSEAAPQVQLTSGEAGGAADLETRIDQVAGAPATKRETSALENLLQKMSFRTALQMQSTERDKAGVFVRFHSAVVLVADSKWDGAQVQSALSDFVRPSMTASELGMGWQPKSGYEELDGLWPLAIAVRGNYLLLSNDPATFAEMLANLGRPTSGKGATYVAGFNHDRERLNFVRFADVVDRPHAAANNPDGEDEPQFFSGTVASLSGSLASFSKETIVVRSEKDKVRQTVTYEWSH